MVLIIITVQIEYTYDGMTVYFYSIIIAGKASLCEILLAVPFAHESAKLASAIG